MVAPTACSRSPKDDKGAPHRTTRVMVACAQKRGHGLPSQRRQIEPPRLPRRVHVRRCSSPAQHQPRQSPQELLRPRARRPAHHQQPPRPDEPAERGDEGPHLGEGGGAVDGPAGTCASPLCVSRVTRPKEGQPKKEIARSSGGLNVCGKRCFMDQSEIFLYSLKPSAHNYDWPPKFLVAKEKKSRNFFKV